MRNDAASGGVGLVLPFDSALDREFWRFLPEGVDLFLARTPHVSGPLGVPLMASVSDPDAVMPVVADMAEALSPDIVVYACTSGSFIRGLDYCRQMRSDMEALGCRLAGTTSEFVLDALDHLGVSRIAVATPYDDEMTHLLVDFLLEADVDVTSVANLGMTGDPKTVASNAVIQLAAEADADSAEALFISCTNLRTFEHIASLESELGKPVLTANQVTIWGALKRADLPMPALDQRLFA